MASKKELDNPAAIAVLNRILETEMAGVVRYTLYSFMVYGYSRIPIVGWFREQAQESITHAHEAGDLITHLGSEPAPTIGPVAQDFTDDIGEILRESLLHEKSGIQEYRNLLDVAEDRSVVLEEYARRMIAAEEMHVGEVEKMLRRPGSD